MAHHDDSFDHGDPKTEADNPVVDAGSWNDNPFAAAFAPPDERTVPGDDESTFDNPAVTPGPAAPPPPVASQVSGLRLPPADANAANPHAQPQHHAQAQQAPQQLTHGAPVITQSGPYAQVARPSMPGLPLPAATPPAPYPPQIPLPDPRPSAPVPHLPMPPPGYGQSTHASQQQSHPTSSINYTIDVILSALEPAKKRKRTVLIVALVLVVGAVAAAIVIGSSNVGEEIEDSSASEAVELEAPTWQELPQVDVAVRSTPSGARLVVNGAVVTGDASTPATVKLVQGHPNTVAAYLDGHLPALVQVPATFDPAAGLAIELAPIDASPTGHLKVLVAEEDNGAEVFVDGKNLGKAPVLAEDLALGTLHHVQVVREGKAPWVQILRTTERRTELTAPPLPSGVFVDRSAEVELTLSPPQAKLHIVGQDEPEGRKVYDKGQLVSIDASLAGHQSWQYNVHTSLAGSFRLGADLPRVHLGKARVRWRVDGRELRTCLVRPGQGFCWREDPAAWLDVEEGTWTVRVYEDKGDGQKVYLEQEPTITFAANQRYKVELEVEDGQIVLDPGKPRAWNPADGTKDDD